MLFRVVPEPVIDEISFSVILPTISSPLSIRRFLFTSLGSVFFNYFPYELSIGFFIEFATEFISLIGIGGPNILVASNRNPSKCIILDN